ncbi:thioesterase family protein [Roseomonas sp. GC11]|uniref:thioesterase family protein n=1 Tax=Roseomonas sp. GC11 TaxID=2950546 RepID=UPI00210B21A1|nr:thioesterase family protein [Roseomonas sp. GC11]MCQ4159586.1 thioesterase family protein [Roseomonas sp. GC11]
MAERVAPEPVLTGPVPPGLMPLGPVLPGWVDHYGHMNLAYYLVAFDMATDLLWPGLGLGDGFRARGLGTFAAESWVGYRRELREGMPLAARSEVLAHDAKRLLLRHRLFHAGEGWESAVCELLFLCVDLGQRRVVEWPAETRAAFTAAPAGPAAERLTLRRRD